MKRTYLVVYEKGPSNYSGFVPDVGGCISVGDTVEEMRANLSEALQLYVDVANDEGLEIPPARVKQIMIPVEGETDPHAEYVIEWLTIDLPNTVQQQAA